MKLIKALTNTIMHCLGVVDSIAEGTDQLAKIYSDACQQARLQQQVESAVEAKEWAKTVGITTQELTKLKASL